MYKCFKFDLSLGMKWEWALRDKNDDDNDYNNFDEEEDGEDEEDGDDYEFYNDQFLPWT